MSAFRHLNIFNGLTNILKKEVLLTASNRNVHFIFCRKVVMVGKYNKSEKRKFLVPIKKRHTETKEDFGQRNSVKWKSGSEGESKSLEKKGFNRKKNTANKNRQENKNRNENKNKENVEKTNYFLNKISFKDTKKESIQNKEIMESVKISNIYIKDILHKNKIFYIYTYQYALIELLRHTNTFVNLLYSDSSVAYIVYALYKIETTKKNCTSLNRQLNTYKKMLFEKKKTNGTEHKENVENVENNEQSNPVHRMSNIYKDMDMDKGRHKYTYKWNLSDNCVLFLVCSKERASFLHEMIIKLKSGSVSVSVLSNENDFENLKKCFLFHNIVIFNIQNTKEVDDNFSILLDNIIFLVVDDISELYKNQKSQILKSVLDICKKRQEENNNLQILLINKTFDEWIFKDVMYFLKSNKYEVKNPSDFLLSSNKNKNNINCLNEKDTFFYFNLCHFKGCTAKHTSLLVSTNEDKKFLILFYILNTNKGKRIVIYYRKHNMYQFYNFVNSYFPCIFLPSAYKEKSKKHLIHIFNNSEDKYVLITNSRDLKKTYSVRSDLFIFYNFVDSANVYVDMLADVTLNPNKNDKGLGTNGHLQKENLQKENLQNGDLQNKNNNENIKKENGEKIKNESILFYNKKECKEYETLNSLFNFQNYILPPIKTMRNNFMNFLINEIENETISDKKYLEEANNIYKKYGTSFVSAALYYIQKKKLLKKKWKGTNYSNVTFIVERNVLINTKSKMIDFLNCLLNFKKHVGDISFFIQNYFYTKKGYIVSIPEVIYNIIHKNKNAKENLEKYKHIHLYILYNNYERMLTTSYARKGGSYQSKVALRRLKKRLNKKKEQVEIGKLRRRLVSIFKSSRRNVGNKTNFEKAENVSSFFGNDD